MRISMRNNPLIQLSLVLLFATAMGACGDTTDEPTDGNTAVVEGDTGADATIDPGDGDAAITPDTGDDDADTTIEPDLVEPDDADTTEPLDGGDVDDVEEDTVENPCPGGAGCDCSSNDECDIGLCLDTPAGKLCAKACIDTCDGGESCQQVAGAGGGDKISVCVSESLTLCSPCDKHADCSLNGIDSLCVDYAAAGKFCGSACTNDDDCPAGKGYACVEVDDGTGASVKQCKLAATTEAGSGKDCSQDEKACDAGETCQEGKCQVVTQPVCECSDWAKKSGTETTCSISNEFGTCSSTRKCTATGLGDCSAATPASEVCNNKDDECDGKVDNLPVDLKCSTKAFKDEGSKGACAADSDCSAEGEACDTTDGTCKTLVGECFGTPNCLSNGTMQCVGAKTPKVELCNGEDDDCDNNIDEDFLWTSPDASEIGVGKACGTGPCSGGTVLCESFASAACSTAGKAVAEKGACDGIDSDCDGSTDDGACEDDNACTDDVCDSDAKSCSNEANVDCDDSDQCTTDSCDGKNGGCVHGDYNGSCDDGNACTVGDKCGTDSGAWSCLAGDEILDEKACDDNNACTKDGCNVDTGCEHNNVANEVPCYTGADKTEDVGVCIGGVQKCKDGVLLEACENEVLPNKEEACDGKDDNCNGQTDEGCKPTSVTVTFSSAYVSGKSGKIDVQMLVGPSGPVGKSKGDKYEIDFGFLAWLMSLYK